MPTIDLKQYRPQKAAPAKQSSTSFSAILNREITFGNGQLADKKKEEFYAEMSTLLHSGIDLKTALELVLVDQGKDKILFEGIKARVLAGSSLSESILSAAKFSDYEYYSIRIGEETGRLAEVLTELAKYYKDKIQQRRKIISAVTYPLIVLSTSLGAMLFMIKFVVPMFADVFKRFGGKLPAVTEAIIRVSELLDNYFIYLFALFVIIIIFFTFNKNKLWFRKGSSALVLKIPLVGNIVKKIYLARFANTMRLLVSSNTPLLKSIALVRQMISFYPLESSLGEVERDIMKGGSLHQSLSRSGFYPPKFIQLIKVGEEVNRLGHFFEKIASQYTDEVEYRTNAISSMMEPLIIIFLGLVVGLILIAMYLPMFQMSNSF